MVFKMQHAKPRRSTNPMVVLDYRCYVEDGQIGTNYDPTLRQCLTKLSKMTAEQVQKEYGFPYKSSAAVLQQRAAGGWGLPASEVPLLPCHSMLPLLLHAAS